jgi:mono/diheme cytochrome c family protein
MLHPSTSFIVRYRELPVRARGANKRVLLLSVAAFGMSCAKILAAANTPTFNRDVAPIFFRQCVECHHPGATAPFSLTNYGEVKKRAKTIVRVISSRYMPPWPPEPGYGEFAGARHLSDAEIETIDRWVRSGATEGAARDLPPLPAWREGWQLGTPDLVLTPPKAFELPAEGPDVYRNFVLPEAATVERYVRAVEFQPGDSGAIHHAFVMIDETGDARRLESLENQPGFPGMRAGRGARSPGGFVSWQPGRRPVEAPEGMAWPFRKGSELVLQLHLRPTGKPEKIQPRIGLYFTDQAPTRPYMLMLLRSTSIDIPPGAADYAIESSYQLPVDVNIIGIAPHLHVLGKEARGWAELPDGHRVELIFIKRWDFNWQGDYRYAQPVALPKGTILKMRFTYDNSEKNARNPNHPPRRVQYGLETSDEMGELWFWLETKSAAELATLQREHFSTYGLRDKLAVNEALLRRDPKDAASRTELGVALAAMGKTDDALTQLRQAIADDPQAQRAFYALGTLLIKRGDLDEAASALTRATEIDPRDAKAQSNLGTVLLNVGKTTQAIERFQAALRVTPNDALALQGLEKARVQLGK